MGIGRLDVQASEIFAALNNERKSLKVNRINSTMLLKALLEAEESPLYDALSLHMEDPTYYPDMIDETYAYAPQGEAQLNEGQTLPEMEFAYLGEKFSLTFDNDLMEMLALFAAWLQVKEIVTIKDLTAIFIITMTKNVRTVFRTYGVDTKFLKREFEKHMDSIEEAEKNEEDENEEKQENTSKAFKLPDEFKGFVKNLNESFKNQTCDISGRDRECKLVWQTLQKKTKRNVVLIGPPGAGKTSVAEKITYDIITANCPKEFKNHIVLSLDVTSSVAGTQYRGQAEERYSAFAEFLVNQKNVIVFIDEIHLIRGAGACREGEIDLANALKPILAGGVVQIIGATTIEEYNMYFSKDGAIKRVFVLCMCVNPK